jgi:EmrB/QacA subfamily drug resistance transporter
MPSHHEATRWYALAILCAASFVVILDASIVLVAMPSMARDLGFTGGGVQWVLSGYGLAFGGLLLLGGRCADLLGRRRMFMVGTAVFVATSLLCALAWAPAVLVGARVGQGVSAAVMSPSALALVTTMFKEGNDRNRALAVWGATAGLGGTAGPLVGGPLTGGLGWEWVFVINIPIGAVLLALSPVLLRESRSTGPRGFDVVGALTITGALTLVAYAVVAVPGSGWLAPSTLGALLAAVVLLAVFVAVELRTSRPLVPLRIFRSRTLVAGNLVLVFFGMTALGIPFVLTEYAQRVLGYSPMQFGFMTAIMALAAVVGNFGSQPVVARHGPAPVAVVSVALAAAGAFLLAAVSVDGGYFSDIFWGLLVYGPALGAGFVAGAIASLNGVAEHEAGLASGLNNTSFQFGATLGIAVLTTVSLSRANEYSVTTGQSPLSASALTEGFQAAFLASAVFAVVGMVGAVLMFQRRKDVDRPAGEVAVDVAR